MTFEVLISAMNQSDLSLAAKSNIKTSCIIINQTKDDRIPFKQMSNDNRVIMYSYCEKGLSNSRNHALEKSQADICLIADDDEFFIDGFDKTILEAFEQLPFADIIVFNIESINNRYNTEPLNTKIKRIPKWKTYGSVHIAFRREPIIQSELHFNPCFGSGSGMYSMAEDSLFFLDAHKKKLKCYTYPQTIAKVDFSKSTWFNGYNEKYFFDIGAFLSASYPFLKFVLKYYYVFRMKDKTDMPPHQIIRWINNGFQGYKKKQNYNSYVNN